MTALDELRPKVDAFRRLATERGLDVRIEEPVPLPVIDDCPPGVRAAFSLFSLVEGSFFRFAVPPEILDEQAWLAIPVYEHRPINEVIAIGAELWQSQYQTRFQDKFEGEPIVMDIVRGDVYFADADAWMQVDEAPDEDFEPHEFAPDVPTFFNDFVFGPRYPELVTTVLGAGSLTHRVGKGPDKGELSDTWLRLLQAAGVVPELSEEQA